MAEAGDFDLGDPDGDLEADRDLDLEADRDRDFRPAGDPDLEYDKKPLFGMNARTGHNSWGISFQILSCKFGPKYDCAPTLVSISPSFTTSQEARTYLLFS